MSERAHELAELSIPADHPAGRNKDTDFSMPLPIPKAPPLPDFSKKQEEEQASRIQKRQLALSDALELLQKLTGKGKYHTREEQFILDARALQGKGRAQEAKGVAFQSLYPTFSEMRPEQKDFYRWWKQEFLAEHYLPAEEGYHHLLLYELVNETMDFSAEKTMSLLKKLFLSANSMGHFCSGDILLAERDWILFHHLPLNYLAETAGQDVYQASSVFWVAVLADPELAAEAGCSFTAAFDRHSNTRFLHSPFVKKEKARMERALFLLLQRCNQRYEKECGGFCEYYAGRKALYFAPFANLLYAAGKPALLSGTYPFGRHLQYTGQDGKIYATLQGLSEDYRFFSMLGLLGKALECRMRAAYGFQRPLKYPETLPAGLQKVVDETVSALQQEEKEAARRIFTLDNSILDKARQETGEIQEKLIAVLGHAEEAAQEEQEPIPGSLDSAAIVPETVKEKADPPAEEQEAETLFAGQSWARTLLTALFLEKEVPKTLAAVSKSKNLMPLAVIDALNELLYPVLNDNAIDETASGFRIYPEYQEEIKKLLQDNNAL